MKIYLLIAGITSIMAISACTDLVNSQQTASQAVTKTSSSIKVAANQSFSYQDYAEVLQTYVNKQGLVDYTKLQANRKQLDRFNQSLGAVSPQTYESWSENEQIAFLINAYNSFTLQSIIDRDPLKDSVKNISGVWNKRQFTLAGSAKTLDNIEHDTLRQNFNEPRIHVALVCAAISCPPLLNQPYLPEELDTQLNNQTVKFASSPHGLRIDKTEQKVYLSSIFKWYGKDFIKTYGVEEQFAGNEQQRAVLNYFSTKLNSVDRQYIEQNDYQVKYLDYNWSLNKQ